jgi:hypothetical protein
VKTDRFFSASLRAAAVVLAGLLVTAGGPAAGQRYHVGSLAGAPAVSYRAPESRTKKLAKALSQQVGEAQQRFDESRRALPLVKEPHGEPAYTRQEVAGLVIATAKDLDQAIAQVGDPRLAGLRAWAAEELRPVQEELAAPAGHTAALPPDLFAPRAIALVASLGWLPLPELAAVKAAAPKKAAPKKAAPTQTAPKPAAPKPATITAEKANGLLDQVGEVVGRVFFLASHDDLEVKLWVGSTPVPRATFRFWPQGEIKGSAPAPLIVRTNGERDHVLRGLYSYSAAWTKGAVTELIEYPNPAGAPAARLASERLDLVNGSGFFCCRFDEQYCQHVAKAKECHP